METILRVSNIGREQHWRSLFVWNFVCIFDLYVHPRTVRQVLGCTSKWTTLQWKSEKVYWDHQQ